MSPVAFWASLTLTFILVQAFYAMSEMAMVSFSKVRLHYYVSQGSKRARWLKTLLDNPARLFGTTLLGVNVALQIGSECSRRFYEALELNANWAPLTQVLIVLIFAELAPQFAARMYSERVALFGVGLVYASSVVLRPITYLLGKLSALVNRLLSGQTQTANGGITREEIQALIQVSSQGADEAEGEFERIVANIMSLRKLRVADVMEPLSSVPSISGRSTVLRLRKIFEKSQSPIVLVYNREPINIVGVASAKDFMEVGDERLVADLARQPWFISEDAKIFPILSEFRHNDQKVGVVLGTSGQATGVMTLDDITDEVFGHAIAMPDQVPGPVASAVIERRFPGNMRIKDFNEQFQVQLEDEGCETLEQLFEKMLGHMPELGQSVRVGPFELTAVQVSLRGVPTVAIYKAI